MHILIIHEVSYLTKPVYEYQDFAERLAAAGHEVTVLDYDESGDGKPLDIKISRTGLANVRLVRPAFSTVPAWKYISAKFISYTFLKKIFTSRQIDAALVYSVFINGTAAVKLCNQFGIPLVYRTLDAYHLLHKNSLARAMLKSGESYIYRNAKRISVTNDKMIPYVREIAGQPLRDNPVVLKHGVDTEFFKVMNADAELTQKWSIAHTDKVIIFLGTTYSFSSLDALIEEMPLLLARIPGLRLLVVGGGELDSVLRQSVDKLGLQGKVILTGMVSYDLVPRYLSLAKLALNPFQINSVTENIIPIKVLQYLSSGVPMLSSPIRDVVSNFPEGESGAVYADVSDIKVFCGRIIELLADDDNLTSLSSMARRHICENFDINKTVVNLTKMLGA